MCTARGSAPYNPRCRYQRLPVLKELKINSNSIETLESVKFLGVKIDNHLKFESHISTIYKKAAGQLNALSHLKSFLNLDQRSIIANSFICSNFNYSLLIWDFCSQRLMNKIINIQKRTRSITFLTMKHD